LDNAALPEYQHSPLDYRNPFSVLYKPKLSGISHTKLTSTPLSTPKRMTEQSWTYSFKGGADSEMLPHICAAVQ